MERENRQTSPASEPLFPTRRAFIVQFTRDADPGASASVCGRVEHVATGQSARFATADDLFAFVHDVMQDRKSTDLSEEVGS